MDWHQIGHARSWETLASKGIYIPKVHEIGSRSCITKTSWTLDHENQVLIQVHKGSTQRTKPEVKKKENTWTAAVDLQV